METVGTWTWSGNGVWITTAWYSVTTICIVGPRTTVIGAGELGAGEMLDDAAPALEVLGTAAGTWALGNRTWRWAAFRASSRAIGRNSPACGLTAEGTSRASSGSS
jgi:hypothetical protein